MTSNVRGHDFGEPSPCGRGRAGFGGLEAVHRLAGAPVGITFVDRRNHHLFQPLLYQVATASLAPSEIAWPIRHLLRKRREVTTLLASVECGSTSDARASCGSMTVRCSPTIRWCWRPARATPISAMTIGSRSRPASRRSRTRRPSAAAFSSPSSTAERETDERKAGGAPDLRHCRRRPDRRRACRHDRRTGARHAARRLPPHRHAKGAHRSDRGGSARASRLSPRICRLTPAFARSGWASRSCSGSRSPECIAEGVVFGGKTLAAATIIWAAGVQSSPAAQWLDAPADKAGRLKVEPDLTVPGHPEIFAIGDAAIVLRPDGRPVPGIAPAAKQEGAYVANVIRARLRGEPAPPPFRYKHAGDLATIGKRRAVIDFGWIKLRGPIAWWLWGFAHIYFLIGVRNRLSVALNWLWIYARDQRSARLIAERGAGGRKRSAIVNGLYRDEGSAVGGVQGDRGP